MNKNSKNGNSNWLAKGINWLLMAIAVVCVAIAVLAGIVAGLVGAVIALIALSSFGVVVIVCLVPCIPVLFVYGIDYIIGNWDSNEL